MMKRVERKSSAVGEYMSTSVEGQRYSHWAEVYAGVVCDVSNIRVREQR
jgi:hypothetical protein